MPGADQVNPFKQYHRKRGGKAGQSFYATIVADGVEKPAYAGDIMLAGGGETFDKGQWITLWIDEDSSLHPFAGFTRRSAGAVGQKFAAVFVVTAEPGGDAEPVTAAVQSAGSVRKLSQDAYLIVTGGFFCQWLEEKSEWTEKLHKAGRVWNADTAKSYVKHMLDIESLSDLDRDAEKAKLFHELVRKPFSQWRGRE